MREDAVMTGGDAGHHLVQDQDHLRTGQVAGEMIVDATKDAETVAVHPHLKILEIEDTSIVLRGAI